MRTNDFFTAVDASSVQTSAEFEPDCGQDMRWLIQISSSGLDGNPKLFIEETIDGSIWTSMDAEDTCDGFFELDNGAFGVKDSYFMARKMRLRLDPNGNTTGTVTALMVYKTKV